MGSRPSKSKKGSRKKPKEPKEPAQEEDDQEEVVRTSSLSPARTASSEREEASNKAMPLFKWKSSEPSTAGKGQSAEAKKKLQHQY